jgi:hypothetical protein
MRVAVTQDATLVKMSVVVRMPMHALFRYVL